MGKPTVYTDPTLITKALAKPHEDHSCRCVGCLDAIKARNTVVERMNGLIWGMALKLANVHSTPPEELVNVAVCKIIRVFCKFDPTKKISPITYFGKIAWREMSEYASRDMVIVPPPEHRVTFRTKADSDRARSIRSLEATVTQDDSGRLVDIGHKSRTSVVDHREWSPEEHANDDDKKHLLQLAIGCLKPRLREVITRRTNGDSLRVISIDLKVSRELVRQLESEAKEKIKQYILEKRWLRRK